MAKRKKLQNKEGDIVEVWEDQVADLKEAALKARREALRRRNEVMEQVKIAVVITAVVVVGLMFLMFAMFSPF